MARRRRGLLTAAPLAALALAGCLHGDAPPREPVADERGASPKSGAVTVRRGHPDGIRYVIGARAYGLADERRPARLRGAVDPTLVATLSPAAALDASGRRLAYNTWAEGGPAIRVYEVGRGADRLLEAGAFSIGWRADGGLAYVRLTRLRLDPRRRRPRGHVVVRRDTAATAVRWSREPDHYVIAGWARDRLLAYRIPRARGRWPELLVFDGPGRPRTLARRSGLVALSPDGRSAMVTSYGRRRPEVRVLHVGTGAEESRLELRDGPAAGAVRWITEAGSWTGELVVAKASPGLIVFRMSGSAIAVDQVLRFDRATYPLGVFEPTIDTRGTRITMWAQRAPEPRAPIPPTTVLTCDRLERRCLEDAKVATSSELRLIADPSRP